MFSKCLANVYQIKPRIFSKEADILFLHLFTPFNATNKKSVLTIYLGVTILVTSKIYVFEI